MLKTLVERFQSRPHKGAVLIPWIRQIMIQHASYLITVPNLSEYLSGFYQTIDSRVAAFKRLNRLSGRLDLILSQVERRNAQPVDQDVDDPTAPLVIYNEGACDHLFSLSGVQG